MNITTKGQVTIPQEIRAKYHLEPNTSVDFVEENGRVYLCPSTTHRPDARFKRLRGRSDTGMTTEQILALTREAKVAEPEPDYGA